MRRFNLQLEGMKWHASMICLLEKKCDSAKRLKSISMKIKEHYPLEKNKTKIPNVYCQCVSLIIQKLGEKI